MHIFYSKYLRFLQNAFKLEYKNEARVIYGISVAPVRHRSTTPLNTIIMFVPQQEVSMEN